MAKKKIHVRRRGHAVQNAESSLGSNESATTVVEEATAHVPMGNAGIMLNELVQGRKQFLDNIKFATTDEPKIQVHPELKRFIPRLVSTERIKLRNSLQAEGCRDAIILWRYDEDQWFIVDGHNRFEICDDLDIEVPYRLMDFTDLHAVKNFMMDLQLGKRNLVKWQVSYYRGMKYMSLKNSHGGARISSEQNVHLTKNAASEQNVHLKKVSEQLAEEFGVSHMTIQRDAKFYLGIEALPIDVKEHLMARSIKIKKQTIEYIGIHQQSKFMDEDALHDYLVGKVVVDEENADEETVQWSKDYSSVRKLEVSQNTFDLKLFKTKELNRCEKWAKEKDQETLKQILSTYEQMIEVLKQSL